MTTRCRRLWQVEAWRDHRLSEQDAQSLVRHFSSCVDCARELRVLGAIGQGLQDACGVHEDEVSLRRVRQAVLERANAQWTERPERQPRRGATLAMAAAAVVVVVVVGIALVVQGPRSAQPPSVAAAVTVRTPAGSAQWRQEDGAGQRRVVLSRGTLEFATRRAPTDPRLVVLVPDGQIEDLGTVFRVTVEDGMTREIQVSDGAIVFFRRGVEAVRVTAGGSWSAVATPNSARAAGLAPVVASDASPSPAGSADTARSAPSSPATVAASPDRASRRGPSEPVGPPSLGPAGRAAEDAAYLEIVALAREGRSEEARLVARAYLRRFPHGFRRIEVERLAR